MRLYICIDGSYAGTQADAGKGFTQVEVPTDKAGLLVYLNAVAARDPAESPVNAPPASATPIRAPESPRASLRGQYALQAGRELDQVEEWIDQAHGWQLVRLVSMVTHRLSALAKGLSS